MIERVSDLTDKHTGFSATRKDFQMRLSSCLVFDHASFDTAQRRGLSQQVNLLKTCCTADLQLSQLQVVAAVLWTAHKASPEKPGITPDMENCIVVLEEVATLLKNTQKDLCNLDVIKTDTVAGHRAAALFGRLLLTGVELRLRHLKVYSVADTASGELLRNFGGLAKDFAGLRDFLDHPLQHQNEDGMDLATRVLQTANIKQLDSSGLDLKWLVFGPASSPGLAQFTPWSFPVHHTPYEPPVAVVRGFFPGDRRGLAC